MEKQCTKCKSIKPLIEFGKDSCRNDGFTYWCKQCKNHSYRTWFKTNDKVKEKAKKDYHSNKSKYKNWELKRQFGITLEEYNNLLEIQNKVCYICGNTETSRKHRMLSVDHDHKTNKVRGLLCSNCNLGIGNLKDNVEYLKKAIEYLEKNK